MKTTTMANLNQFVLKSGRKEEHRVTLDGTFKPITELVQQIIKNATQKVSQVCVFNRSYGYGETEPKNRLKFLKNFSSWS